MSPAFGWLAGWLVGVWRGSRVCPLEAGRLNELVNWPTTTTETEKEKELGDATLA